MKPQAQTRSLNAQDALRLLRFLKESVFTAENIAKAQDMGKSLGDLLADIFVFAQHISGQFPAGSRDLTLYAEIDEAGLTDTLELVQFAARKH